MRNGPIAAGVALIVVCAVVQGLMTRRWSEGESEELKRLVAQYKQIPQTVGDWVSVPNKVNVGEMQTAEAHSYFSRTFRNTKTNEVIGVLMICGYARAVAVHTPDACYVAQGFSMSNDPRTIVVPSGEKAVSMYESTFQRGHTRQEIFWAWNGGNGWQAPSSPRYTFPAYTPLTKIYLIADMSNGSTNKPNGDTALKFADIFLAAAGKALYPPATAAPQQKLQTATN